MVTRSTEDFKGGMKEKHHQFTMTSLTISGKQSKFWNNFCEMKSKPLPFFSPKAKDIHSLQDRKCTHNFRICIKYSQGENLMY